MFPLNSNMPYIKETGERDKLGNVIGSGGGGSELPSHTIADAGKVLGVDDEGNLVWETIDVVNQFSFATSPNSTSTVESNATEGGN